MTTRNLVVLVITGLGVMVGALSLALAAEPERTVTSGVKYKGAKALNFEELLIEGAAKRPEMSVVTGDANDDANGLLRLRENFIDRMTVDAGEEIP